MAGLHAIPWQRARPLGGDSVDIFFTSGVEPCYVLDHVAVTYEEDRVLISLFEGHDPRASDTACIELAAFKVVRVALDEPLGERRIVDGSRA